jgi:hypothetical protein
VSPYDRKATGELASPTPHALLGAGASLFGATNTKRRFFHGGHKLLPQRGPRLPITASGCQGSDKAMMAPPHGPQKRLLCRESLPGVRDSRPLGAGMDSSACLAGTSTGTTGARPSPTSTGIGCWPWVQHGDHGAPSGGPLKTTQLAGEKGAGSGVRALWGQQWTRLAAGHGVAASRPTPTSVAGSIGGVVRSSR